MPTSSCEGYLPERCGSDGVVAILKSECRSDGLVAIPTAVARD